MRGNVRSFHLESEDGLGEARVEVEGQAEGLAVTPWESRGAW